MRQSCWFCGAPLDGKSEQDSVTCEYCGHEIKIVYQGEKNAKRLMDAAMHRNEGAFDKALEIYEELIRENRSNYHAIWGRLLCKYGVAYIERENEERIATCRISVGSDFKSEKDYQLVKRLALYTEREQFRKDAELISEIQKKIHGLKDKNVDIFICYKETEDARKGQKTADSFDAELLYEELSYEGYKVFYAKRSLRNKAGADYEAEIFNAIAKAKVMIVFGSKAEYFRSSWVQSEWLRFLEEMKTNKKKVLIPLIKDIKPDQLPELLKKKQGIRYDADVNNNYKRLKQRLRNIFGSEIVIKTEESLEADADARDAVVLIEEGKTEDGIEKLRKAAEKESPEAWFLLGCALYEMDEKLLQKGNQRAIYKEAFQWFQKAADAGFSDARFQVGFMYEYGIGVEKSPADAETYYMGLDHTIYPIPHIE